ncbi:hypothetical protein EB796_011660 [Bugula neritina]|uniref:Uncharacterized protein n=1 Tax=Bugula neritina TaxID=10212 RepID=A0A7J7JXH8_BUGNE|nr:hypothetical protein EB796_011660 [Bugula neritina]
MQPLLYKIWCAACLANINTACWLTGAGLHSCQITLFYLLVKILQRCCSFGNCWLLWKTSPHLLVDPRVKRFTDCITPK